MLRDTRKARNINTFKRFQDMTKILFVCHGNICRSPMAEFVMKDLVKKAGVENRFHIESAATSTEEIGNPVYPPARRKLAEHSIDCTGKTARQLIRADYDRFDLLIGMDRANLRDMGHVCGGDPDGKLCLLMDCTDRRKGAPAKPSFRLCGERSRGGMSELSASVGSEGYEACGDDVADPWYTGDFEITWRDVLAGCQSLLSQLQNTGC